MPPQQQAIIALAVQSFYLDRQAAGCSSATLTWYRKYLGAWANWTAQHQIANPEAITATHIRTYLAELQDSPASARTVHHHASALRAFCNFLVADDLLAANPMHKVKMPRLPQTILPAFTLEDVFAILSVCHHDRDRAIVLMLLDTGLRAAELCALSIGCISLVTGAVTVHAGKGNRDRLVYLGARTRKVLLRYIMSRRHTEPDDPLWLSLDGGHRLTHWGLRLMLHRLGERSGVHHCHPHTFRRTFALWSLRAGMNVYALQRLMGHADLQVLRQYLALVESDLQAAHAQYGAVDRILLSR